MFTQSCSINLLDDITGCVQILHFVKMYSLKYIPIYIPLKELLLPAIIEHSKKKITKPLKTKFTSEF